MPLKVWPETLQNGERLAIIEPDRPAQVIPIVTGFDRAKLTATPSEDVVILISRLVLGPVLYPRADGVDNLLHIVEFKSEDDDLRMQIGVKQARGKRPLWSRLAFMRENIGHIPSMSLNLSEEFLVCWVRIIRMAGVADHAVQGSTQTRTGLQPGSPVNFFPMPNREHEDHQDSAMDLINDSIITGPYSPCVREACHFLATRRKRIVPQRLNLGG
jgi:hypothetical protein